MQFLGGDDDEVSIIRSANAVADHLRHCRLLAPSTDNVVVLGGDRLLRVASLKASELSIAKCEALFSLLERNMKELYVKSGWGWSEVEKRKDLFGPLSHLLVLYASGAEGAENAEYCDSSTIVGYVCFRFEWDDDDEPEFPVVYCYEMQVSGDFQRLGAGSFLMGLLYKLTKWHRIRKILLTVFKINEMALKFYKKINFKVDSSSPSRFGDQSCNYEILSLKVKV